MGDPRKLLRMLGILLSMAVLAFSPLAQADPGAEKEARAAFVKLVEAAKKKQTDKFKQMIAKAELAEMEAMEKERPGMLGFMMEMLAGDNPKQYQAEIKGDHATFVKKVTHKSSSGSSTETSTVHMLREGGQWKFGKPR
jgi:hypothetical protein